MGAFFRETERTGMALTAYCRKCGKEVDAGEVCPFCGSRLGKNAAHAAWCVERVPVKDWICWNAVMRLLLPAALTVLLLVLLAEGISGGAEAVEKLFLSGFPVVLLILLLAVLAAVLVVLALQGKELTDYVVDSRGIHETHYLPAPTPLKLILRLKSPSLIPREGPVPVIRLSEKHLAWKDVARVQLWAEKTMVLYYAPSGWLRLAVVCTPFTWDDVMELTRDKLGKKRKILLPPSLVIPAEPKTRRAKAQARPAPEVEEALEQLRMEERMAGKDAGAPEASETGPEDPNAPETFP